MSTFVFGHLPFLVLGTVLLRSVMGGVTLSHPSTCLVHRCCFLEWTLVRISGTPEKNKAWSEARSLLKPPAIPLASTTSL